MRGMRHLTGRMSSRAKRKRRKALNVCSRAFPVLATTSALLLEEVLLPLLGATSVLPMMAAKNVVVTMTASQMLLRPSQWLGMATSAAGHEGR